VKEIIEGQVIEVEEGVNTGEFLYPWEEYKDDFFDDFDPKLSGTRATTASLSTRCLRTGAASPRRSYSWRSSWVLRRGWHGERE
jgi:hypothetical protein